MDNKSTKDRATTPSAVSARKKRRFFRRFIVVLLLALLMASVIMYVNNNISFMSDQQFAQRLDEAIERSNHWLQMHKSDVLERKNVALIYMLQDSYSLSPEPVFTEIVDEYMAMHLRPSCWRRVLDREYPIDPIELNREIQKEILDNKWVLYAVAPEQARLTDEQLQDLYDPDKWYHRKLTHQLLALVHLGNPPDEKKDVPALIEHLSRRIGFQLRFNMAVVDIYIQKNAFVLKAGHPENINRRWIERVIDNQHADGGWNDRWWCFESRRKPSIVFDTPASNQHATIQGIWLLNQVKYRYPEYFGLAPDSH